MTATLTLPPLPSQVHTDLLGAPTGIPFEWLTQIPDWIFGANAHDIHVQTDPDCGELGRAAALYYSHDSCYMNDVTECWLPPASPSGNEAFYVGHVDYGGVIGRVNVGTIPIAGGHTDTSLPFEAAVAARNDLPERQRLIGSLFDLILPYDPEDMAATFADPAAAVEAGAARQAGVFLGAGTPEITVGEALTVNASGLSGEWWPRRNFMSTTGELIEIGMDALGPVLVTRAAIASNRQGQASAAGAHLPLAASYQRSELGPIVGPSVLPQRERITMAQTAAQWKGAPVAAAAPVIDTSTRPVTTGAPRVACAGGCGGDATAAAPSCSSCSNERPEGDLDEGTEETDGDVRLARLEGELSRLTAPAVAPLPANPTVAVLEGTTMRDQKRLLYEAARAVFRATFENFEEVSYVSGVYVRDWNATHVEVNVDIEDRSYDWRETYWETTYTIEGETVTFGPTAVEVGAHSGEETGYEVTLLVA